MSEKNVLFLHRFGPSLASYRYRAQTPFEQVAKHNGFKTGINAPGDYDIIVVGKPHPDDFPVVESAKKEGAKIVVDFCDDHFEGKQGEMYRRMAVLADHITTGSEVMRARLQRYIERDAAVIPDPYEQPELPPHADGDKFLWFGHRSNINEILNWRPHLKGRNVKVATGPKPVEDMPVVWGPEHLRIALSEANIVLLPTQEGAEYKTPNRLLNAIRAGCFPVCMRHPAYVEFRHHVWVGDFITGIKWTDCFKADLNEMVAAAQDYIRDKYSPETIGTKWAQFLESV